MNTEYHRLQRLCYVNLKLLRIRGYVTDFAFCFRRSYTFDMTDESLRINAVLKQTNVSQMHGPLGLIIYVLSWITCEL